MSVQIKGDQIKNATIASAKLDLTGTYDFSSASLQAANPTNGSDVATKDYVLDLVQGLRYKDPVEVGTQSAPAATYSNGAGTLTADSNGAISIDGITLSLNNRILVKSFTGSAAVANGIYKVTTVGDASNPYVITRTDDFNENDEIPSAACFVHRGTDADALFVCQNDAVTLGTTQITFAQVSGAGAISAGNGISKSGNTISVNEGSGLEFNSGALQVGAGDGISTDANSVSVNLDGSTLSKSASGLKVNSAGIDSLQLAAGSVTAAKINTNIAGDGIVGGSGTALSVNPYHGVSVDGNGVSISLDGSTLSKSASGLKVAANGITSTEIIDNAISAAKISSAVAGDGLAGGSGTALSVDLAASSGLEIASQKLQIKRQANSAIDMQATGIAVQLDGSTLQKGATGLSVNVIGTTNISDAAIDEAKIASAALGNGLTGGSGTALSVDLKPSASGLEFVSNQLALHTNAAKALNVDNTNGLEIKLEADGAILFDGSNGGLEVAVEPNTLEIASNQIQIKDAGVSTVKLADDAVSLDKLKYRAEFETFSGNGSATTFDLQFAVHASWFKKVVVYRNGLRLKYVASNPANVDEYTVANNGASSVCRITLGAAASNVDSLFVDYIYNVS